MGTKRDTHALLRGQLGAFRTKRERIKEEQKEIAKEQENLIDSMQEEDPDDKGIIVDPNDSRGTAFVQQNEGTEVWDEEKIIEYLSKPSRKRLRMAASSRIFDINKWEALVANREITPAVAKKMKYTTEPPKPYIRWGKRKDDSL